MSTKEEQAQEEAVFDDQVIDTQLDDKPESGKILRDRQIKENLEASFGQQAELAWRFFERTGRLSSTLKDATQKVNGKKVRLDIYDPKYAHCPAYVRRDPGVPINIADPTTYKRCGKKVPSDIRGKSATYWAMAHMTVEHFHDWYEVNKRTKTNGRLHRTDDRDEAPPMSFVVTWPRWVKKGEKGQIRLTDFEDAQKQAKEEYVKQMEILNKAEARKANDQKNRDKKKEEKLTTEEVMARQKEADEAAKNEQDANSPGEEADATERNE